MGRSTAWTRVRLHLKRRAKQLDAGTTQKNRFPAKPRMNRPAVSESQQFIFIVVFVFVVEFFFFFSSLVLSFPPSCCFVLSLPRCFVLSGCVVSEVRAARAAECSETDRSFVCSYFRKRCARSTAASSTEVSYGMVASYIP